jgi:hypothetical protein
LLDNDAALLEAARGILRAWANEAVQIPGGLRLLKDGKAIRVRFRHFDIAGDPCGSLTEKTDLVTASAFFDLASPTFIGSLVSAVVLRNAAFHTVLTYDGAQHWSPPSALDEQMCRAFNEHQRGDKGFGPAAGPHAFALLRRAFDAAGYWTEVGDSPWKLDRSDGELMDQLADSVAAAVAETGQVDASTIAEWRAVDRYGARIGHGDILALPTG